MTETESPDAYVEDEPAVEPAAHGYRTYEVYQRERVGETTNLIKPRQLISDDYLVDPYPLVAILREHYPCFRDWVSNRFWITRYDDVTSVLADTANYETRPPTLWESMARPGRSLWSELDVEWAMTRRVDDGLDAAVARTVDAVRADPDLARSFAARFAAELWGETFGLETPEERGRLISLVWRIHRGAGWDPVARVDGLAAFDEAAAWFDELLAARRSGDGDDVVSATGRLDLEGGSATGADLAVSLLDADVATLHGGLANLWFQLLTRPDQLDVVRDDPRMMKFAWLETLRHSPPVIAAGRWARHEVERFGRLFPKGALVWCSVAAANRDPRAFSDPDRFDVARSDLCQREPRGQYRADGLPSGIAIGLGLPSIHPAEPKERPRSRYALTRDVAVAASRALLDEFPSIRLAADAEPTLRSLRLGEMHTCWSLPVTLD